MVKTKKRDLIKHLGYLLGWEEDKLFSMMCNPILTKEDVEVLIKRIEFNLESKS